ncbi:MAG: ribosomal RNA small subunit methyltransferase A [Thermoplasmata archaeon]|nr:ribosomal RNA small subunit methyltransferase A [Candidatus Sysuiplasma acidicola]
MSAGEIRQSLMEIGLYPRKKLGQTFLADDNIADREIAAAAITRRETVLEIGPGLGVLTTRLCEVARKVIAIETDDRLVFHLNQLLANRAEVIHGDAMEVELPHFDVAVGNLPYSVASQLIFRLSDAGMKRGLFMIQREMAERVVAPPYTAEYSRMAAVLQRSYAVKLLFNVGHSHFYPQPDVDSSVLLFRKRKGVKKWPEYERAAAILFSQRRKMMASILRKALPVDSTLDLKSMPYGSSRIEELTVAKIEKVVSWLLTDAAASRMLRNQ